MGGSYVVLERDNFQSEVDGRRTDLYTLRGRRGMVVKFTNLGAKILQILVPDRHGLPGDVALGYETITHVREGTSSMGAFIGRYANRIRHGRFVLDGRTHQLAINPGTPHTLHGGPGGASSRVFDVQQIDDATALLTIDYPDGDQGFPGHVRSRVTYHVSDDDALEISYDAQTDAPTVVNFTSHVYFNLAGHGRADAQALNQHVLTINARAFTPVDPTLLPTGEIRMVAGTPMDFTQPTPIGARLNEPDEQFRAGNGYDHNWVIDKPSGQLALHATLFEPTSGRVMEVHSTEPGLVFYGGNQLAGYVPRDVGKGGVLHGFRSALCLEPGGFPDAPNQSQFPSTVLRPGERYTGQIHYRFSTRT